MKAAYRKNGLVYRESSSEEDGEEGCPLSPEVIEIDDEEDDDDVIAVGCRKSSRFPRYHWCKLELLLLYAGVKNNDRLLILFIRNFSRF